MIDNDRKRWKVESLSQICRFGCKWVVYVAKVQGEMTYQLNTFVVEHSCSRSLKNPWLISKWLNMRLVVNLSVVYWLIIYMKSLMLQS